MLALAGQQVVARDLPGIPALVMNTHITGLAVARSLGRAGIAVLGLDKERGGLGQHTRHLAGLGLVPGPEVDDGAALAEHLLQLGPSFAERPVLFATNDDWVLALARHGVTPERGEILVTGASGGVGSVAIVLLAARGYHVVASTGRLGETAYLKSLGATTVIDRNELSQAGKPLQKERWAGVVDSVGSHTLANAIAQCKYNATVAACGLAQGMDLPTSVAPFILRGVTLAGIDSVYADTARRLEAWQHLALELDKQKLDQLTSTITLSQAIAHAPTILAGQVRGRLVVDVNG